MSDQISTQPRCFASAEISGKSQKNLYKFRLVDVIWLKKTFVGDIGNFKIC